MKRYKGRIKYAQLLSDASEIKFRTRMSWKDILLRALGKNDVILDLPVTKPSTSIPVIELILN